MTIREIIIKYRNEHGLSQRKFAEICGISNGYISMLEKGENHKTKEPITPSIQMYKALATGMGMTLNDLLIMADDAPVFLDGDRERDALAGKDDIDRQIVSLLLSLSPAKKKEALWYLQSLSKREDSL